MYNFLFLHCMKIKVFHYLNTIQHELALAGLQKLILVMGFFFSPGVLRGFNNILLWSHSLTCGISILGAHHQALHLGSVGTGKCWSLGHLVDCHC